MPFDDRISSSLQCNKCKGKGRRIAIAFLSSAINESDRST